MLHPIYRVCSFRIVGDYMLCVTFDDQTEQVIDFQQVPQATCLARFVIRDYSTRSKSIEKSTHSFGRMGRTSIQQHCPTGLTTLVHWRIVPGNGNINRPEHSTRHMPELIKDTTALGGFWLFDRSDNWYAAFPKSFVV